MHCSHFYNHTMHSSHSCAPTSQGWNSYMNDLKIFFVEFVFPPLFINVFGNLLILI